VIPGLEAAALRIGASVARVAGARWLRARSGNRRRTMPLRELAVASGADILQGRSLERQFEQLADEVATRILTTLEYEYHNIPDNECLAAVKLVGDILQSSTLTDQRLLDADLSVPRLAVELQGTHQQDIKAAALSDTAQQLFANALRDALAYLVDILSTLPEFQQRLPAEFLRRDTLIISMLREALDRAPQLAPGVSPPQNADERFTLDYRREVARRQKKIELFGLPSTIPHQSYSLASSYVSLALSSSSRSPSTMPDPETSGSSIEQVLAGNRRLLLLGAAGSGKTTILQWLTQQSAQQSFDPVYKRLNSTIPILLILRQLSHVPQLIMPATEDMTHQQSWIIHADKPQSWVRKTLESGNALVMLDGVDELIESDRQRLQLWLVEMTERFPNNRWVVTSRPEAVPHDWLHSAGYKVAQILPMSPRQIRSFVTNWHDAAAEYADEDGRTNLRQYESRLRSAIDTTPSLRSLANNPLLCAMICAMHTHNRGRLPHDRMQLYRTAMESMLAERDEQRQVAQELILSPEQKVTVLQKVAYWFIVNGKVETPYSTVLDRIREALPLLGRAAEEAEAVLKHLLIRSGLLRRVGVENIDFVHKTFQEYLAAKEAIDTDCIGQIIQHVANDNWRELVILAVGHARPREREQILLAILTLADERPASRRRVSKTDADDSARWFQRLALDCLETAHSLDEDLRQRILSHVQSIFPPRSVTEVYTLASYGSQVLGLLEGYTAPLSSYQLARCIQLAGEIGTSRGLDQLARYSTKARTSESWAALVKAWSHFPPEEYVLRVLDQSPYSKKRLVLTDSKLGSAAKNVRDVASVSWDLGQEVDNLNFIHPDLPVTHLTLTENRRVKSLAPLEGQSVLRVLRLLSCTNLDDDGLPTFLPELIKLQLMHIATPVAESILTQMAGRLEVLSVAGYERDFLAKQLARQSGIQYLELVGIRYLRALNDLQEMPGVRRLRIRDCPELASLNHLERFPRLEHLEIDDCGSLTLSDWYRPKSVKSVKIIDCPTEMDCRTLQGFTGLTELAVSTASLSNFGALSALPIKSLEVSYMLPVDREARQAGLQDKVISGEVFLPAARWWR
jgi:hypothetical protein